jgi:RNA polymerase sigma-70 factor (ECF subfamily)
MQTDEELMRRYQEGSEAAFMELYEKYSPLVYAFIRRRLRASEVEDFYQKVWRQLHEKRELFRDQPFAPWFFVMMRHLLIDEYRSAAPRKVEYRDELFDKLYASNSDETLVEDILNSLPKESRDLVRKHYLEGLSYEDLEKETGLSQTNLRQRLSRALRGLRGYREE